MTIVVGYIPSPEGMAAVDAAVEEARLRNSRLVVVNTGNHGNYNDPVFAAPQDLDALDAQLSAAGIEHEVRQSTEGRSASEELLTTAEAENADILVIGVRKRSPLGKLVMGSTAQEVILDAPCRVLAVKA
ncbi:MAG: universal stress protein [Actinobacteria bacterium]|nr:universal stress protein [Actinomycetota bacterium]